VTPFQTRCAAAGEPRAGAVDRNAEAAREVRDRRGRAARWRLAIGEPGHRAEGPQIGARAREREAGALTFTSSQKRPTPSVTSLLLMPKLSAECNENEAVSRATKNQPLAANAEARARADGETARRRHRR
jgi:hypothetical protein